MVNEHLPSTFAAHTGRGDVIHHSKEGPLS
jgi:hypothetical protein